MKRIPGVVTGIVKSLDDPDGLGRIKLEFPWMAEDSPESNWARIAFPLAGAAYGTQFMPEIGDEVLVAFDQGNLRFPYVLGFLWNGENPPIRDEPSKRAIQTVSGHVLEFDDTEGNESISLSFKGDLPSISMDVNKISIKFSEESFIELTGNKLSIVNSTLVDINP